MSDYRVCPKCGSEDTWTHMADDYGYELIWDAVNTELPYIGGIEEVTNERDRAIQYGAMVAELVTAVPNMEERLLEWLADGIDKYVEL